MRLLRLGDPGSEIPCVRDGSTVRDLRRLTRDLDPEFFAGDGVDRIRSAVQHGGLPELPVAEGMRIGAPIARPAAIVCIGQNYAAHAAETGDPPPRVPIVFFKHPNTLVGAYDSVPIPPESTRTDWEVELAVVIGRRASYLASPGAAHAHIAGYAVSNDVSERAYQMEHSLGQWSKGKCCPAFNPFGPELVTTDEVTDPQDLRLWSTVNGESRQDSTTADMVFDVAMIVWHLSHYLTLEPGDIINTGTPQGVAASGRFPYLADGDVVQLGIDGLGQQRQVFTTTVLQDQVRRP